MGKYDEFDLDIRKKGNEGDTESYSLTFGIGCYWTATMITNVSCENTCVDCISDVCTVTPNTNATCSACHSYCGSACR